MASVLWIGGARWAGKSTVDVVEAAAALGLSVIVVDGSRDAAAVTEVVERRFRPFLREWLY